MTKKTYHEGAEAERKAFKAFLKRKLKVGGSMEMALAWVQGRCDRYRKIKGGL
jgi:hypothetical protein